MALISFKKCVNWGYNIINISTQDKDKYYTKMIDGKHAVIMIQLSRKGNTMSQKNGNMFVYVENIWFLF